MKRRIAIAILALLGIVVAGWWVYQRDSGLETAQGASRQHETTQTPMASIPLDEILEGGPGMDGIPSIDAPEFVSADEAVFVEDDEFGIGLTIGDDSRFYPFSILVWHEIVNDVVGGEAVAVTYCPLCRTGVVFSRTVDGEELEFGVSGKLWKSNLLMYDRSERESLWSQVLGEAVVGPRTGTKLAIVPSAVTTFGSWKRMHPDTKVLTQNTGASRPYGSDPYGDYYTNAQVSFGATFNDDRLHPKTYVLGVEANGVFKAYELEALPVGVTRDMVGNTAITIEKSATGEVRVTKSASGDVLPYIGGFWFSWLAVHPDTLLWEK